MQLALRRDVVTRWVAGFAFWTVVGALATLQHLFRLHLAGSTIDLDSALIRRMGDWYSCALFTPLFFAFARRYPIDTGRWRSSLPIHLAVVAFVVPIKSAIYVQLLRITGIEPNLEWTRYFAEGFISDFLGLSAVMTAVIAVDLHWRTRAERERATRLRAELAEARMDALAHQLQPHFLFNTLHTVSNLMHRNVDAADTMLALLCDMLRRTLAESNGADVSVESEIELLSMYLEIMQMRYADRLDTQIHIAPEAKSASVPRFLLQPLVENALQHGIGEEGDDGSVRVEVSKQGERLVITVSDNGATHDGSVGHTLQREGFGLKHTRERLAGRWGENQNLTIRSNDEGGVTVRIDVPFTVVHVA